MVLVLDDDLGADRFGQQRPGIGRRRRHDATHDRGGLGKLVQAKERHERSL